MATDDQVHDLMKHRWRAALVSFLCICGCLLTAMTTWAVAKATSAKADALDAHMKRIDEFQKWEAETDEMELEATVELYHTKERSLLAGERAKLEARQVQLHAFLRNTR